MTATVYTITLLPAIRVRLPAARDEPLGFIRAFVEVK